MIFHYEFMRHIKVLKIDTQVILLFVVYLL